MKCKKCKAEIKDDSNFCPLCGTPAKINMFISIPNFSHKYIDRWSIGFLFVIIVSAAMLSETSITGPADAITLIITFLVNFGFVFIIIRIYTKFCHQKKPSSFSMIKTSIGRHLSHKSAQQIAENEEESLAESSATGANSSTQTNYSPKNTSQLNSELLISDKTASFLKQEAIKIITAFIELDVDVTLKDIGFDPGFVTFYIAPDPGTQINAVVSLKPELMLRFREITDISLDRTKLAVSIKVLVSAALLSNRAAASE